MKKTLLFPLALALATVVSSSALAQTATGKSCGCNTTPTPAPVVHRALPRRTYTAPVIAATPTSPPAPQKVEVQVQANATLKVPDPVVVEVHVIQSTVPAPVAVERNDPQPEAQAEEVAQSTVAPMIGDSTPLPGLTIGPNGLVCDKRNGDGTKCLHSHKETVNDWMKACADPRCSYFQTVEDWRKADSALTANKISIVSLVLQGSTSAALWKTASDGRPIANATASANSQSSSSASAAASATGGQLVVEP